MKFESHSLKKKGDLDEGEKEGREECSPSSSSSSASPGSKHQAFLADTDFPPHPRALPLTSSARRNLAAALPCPRLGCVHQDQQLSEEKQPDSGMCLSRWRPQLLFRRQAVWFTDKLFFKRTVRLESWELVIVYLVNWSDIFVLNKCMLNTRECQFAPCIGQSLTPTTVDNY